MNTLKNYNRFYIRYLLYLIDVYIGFFCVFFLMFFDFKSTHIVSLHANFYQCVIRDPEIKKQ